MSIHSAKFKGERTDEHTRTHGQTDNLKHNASTTYGGRKHKNSRLVQLKRECMRKRVL